MSPIPNEVRILVRTQNSTKAGFEAIDKEVEAFSKRSAETFARNFSDNLTRNITERLRTVGGQVDQSARAAGDHIGNTMSERITTRITDRIRNVFRSNGADSSSRSTSRSSSDNGGFGNGDRDHVRVSVDVDKQSFLQKISSLGKEAGNKFGGALQTGFTSVFSGDVISTVIKGALITFAGSVLAPALGAAISGGILLALGGGVLAAGIYAAFQNPRILTAAHALKEKLKPIFADFGSNFLGPLENFLAGEAGGRTGLAGVIDQLTPQIKQLGKVFGPVADQLGQGLIGFLQNAMPGILRAAEKAAPLFKTLAEKLPGLGDDIGRFFDHIGNSAPGASEFLGDLIEAIGLVIRLLGNLVEGLTIMYHWARTVTLGVADLFLFMARVILAAADEAFGWIPGFGPKLTAARERVAEFSKNVKRELDRIPDVTISVRFRIVGQAAASAAVRTAQILHNLGYAHGGIKGAASGGGQSGLTWVGEQGPELVDLPAGSRVNTAGDSRRLADQSGGGQGGQMSGSLRLAVDRGTERGVIDALFKMFRVEIHNGYGGNVQTALGS